MGFSCLYTLSMRTASVGHHTGLFMWVLGILALNVCIDAIYQLGCVLSSQPLPFYKGDYKTTNEELAIFYLFHLLLCASLSLKNRVYVIHISFLKVTSLDVQPYFSSLVCPLTRSQRVLQQHDDETGENCRKPNTVGSNCFLLVTSVTLSR